MDNLDHMMNVFLVYILQEINWSHVQLSFKLTVGSIFCVNMTFLRKSYNYAIRDREKFFQNSEKFLYPSDSESSESTESTGKKFFRKFEFLTIGKSTFIFFSYILIMLIKNIKVDFPMVKNSNFRKFFLPVDSVDSGDSESLGYKNFSEF